MLKKTKNCAKLATILATAIACHPVRPSATKDDVASPASKQVSADTAAKSQDQDRKTFEFMIGCDSNGKLTPQDVLDVLIEEQPKISLLGTVRLPNPVSSNGMYVNELGIFSLPQVTLAEIIDTIPKPKVGQALSLNDALSQVTLSFGIGCVSFLPSTGSLVGPEVLRGK